MDKYNAACRSIVERYSQEWKKTVRRVGRWVDMENPYFTMDVSFMQSVWWVFKQIYKKGLIYEGYKVVPYSTGISTVLSNFEANLNYKSVQDPAITVSFPHRKRRTTYLSRLDDHSMDAPEQLGPRGRRRHRLRERARKSHRPSLHLGRSAAGASFKNPDKRSMTSGAQRQRPARAWSMSRSSTYLPIRRPGRIPSHPLRSRHDRKRYRDRAHGPCLRRGRLLRLPKSRSSDRQSRRRRRDVHRGSARLIRAAESRKPIKILSSTLKRRDASSSKRPSITAILSASARTLR